MHISGSIKLVVSATHILFIFSHGPMLQLFFVVMAISWISDHHYKDTFCRGLSKKYVKLNFKYITHSINT